MKYFWKIFFSTMFICICCFEIGSYFLINSGFNSAINQEKNLGYKMCDIVYYSIKSEIDNNKNIHSEISSGNEEDLIKLKNNEIFKTANSISIKNINGVISFRIIDSDNNIVFSSINNSLEPNILNNISTNQKGYILKEKNKETYIHTFRPIKLLNRNYYIEVEKNISYVTENMKMQYNISLKLTIAILIIGGILTAIISKYLIKPIKTLTSATNKIASGDFSKAVPIRGNDEVTDLSKHFNTMASELECKINELRLEAEKQELFVASFSHELKTPLTSIIGYSDMMRLKKMSSEKVALCANHIFEEGKRLENLSMRLLEIVVLKRREIELKKVSTRNFFENIQISLKPILDNLNIEFRFDIESSIIKIEPNLMKTVLINLIDNGRKAIEKDGKISLKGYVSGNDYIINVIDNGKGIEKCELEKITQAFYMVDKSRTRREGGAGLGLALCDEIIKLHGALIEFESKINEGTSVNIILKGACLNEKI